MCVCVCVCMCVCGVANGHTYICALDLCFLYLNEKVDQQCAITKLSFCVVHSSLQLPIFIEKPFFL